MITVETLEKNIITADKAPYDKINEIIITYDRTEILLKEGYRLVSKNVSYDIKKKTLGTFMTTSNPLGNLQSYKVQTNKNKYPRRMDSGSFFFSYLFHANIN